MTLNNHRNHSNIHLSSIILTTGIPITNVKINNVRKSTKLVNSLMNITIDLKFIFTIDAFREYNSHIQDITN